MPFPIRQVSIQSVNQDVDAYDLQALSMFRNKQVRKGNFENDFDYGLHQEEEGDSESKALNSRRGELRVDLKKREEETFSHHQESLPDFKTFYQSKDFQRFMALLRRADNLGTYEDVENLLNSVFSDPSLKHAALEGALKLLKEQGGADPQLQKLLNSSLQHLLDQDGAAVRAGYNISQVAAEMIGSEELPLTSLRDFYCAIVFGNLSLAKAYEYIMHSFPDDWGKVQKEKERKHQQQQQEEEEEVEGEKGKKRLEKALDFLLHSLAVELKSNNPSLDLPHLKTIMDGICEMEFFRNAYSSFLEMFEKIHEDYKQVPIAPSQLMDELLQYITKERVADEDFLVITEQFSIPPLQSSIEFLTKIYQMIRLFPERVFSNDKSRANFLNALQGALDVAISQETEEIP